MEQKNKTEEKVKEYECTNCSWNGTELSKSCRTRGSFEMQTNADGKQVEVHKLNKEGLQRCEGCGYLDNKCPICGDEVGEPGIRKKMAEQKAKEDEIKHNNLRGKAIF